VNRSKRFMLTLELYLPMNADERGQRSMGCFGRPCRTDSKVPHRPLHTDFHLFRSAFIRVHPRPLS
jgi:hypothetical protein